MNELKLDGVVRFKHYVFRDWCYDVNAMFYNEKGEQIVLCFDSAQQCCEDFALDYDKQYHNGDIVSNNGIVVKWKFQTNDCGDVHSSVVFTIKTDKRRYTIRARNIHNGYYAHYVKVSQNGTLVWKELL